MIDTREFFRVIDAVLQRQNKRPVANQRLDLFGGGFGVVGFDAKQNQIDFADRCRISVNRALSICKSPLGLVTRRPLSLSACKFGRGR